MDSRWILQLTTIPANSPYYEKSHAFLKTLMSPLLFVPNYPNPVTMKIRGMDAFQFWPVETTGTDGVDF